MVNTGVEPNCESICTQRFHGMCRPAIAILDRSRLRPKATQQTHRVDAHICEGGILKGETCNAMNKFNIQPPRIPRQRPSLAKAIYIITNHHLEIKAKALRGGIYLLHHNSQQVVSRGWRHRRPKTKNRTLRCLESF